MKVKQPSSRFNQISLRQLEGRNPVREALRAGTPVVRIIMEEKLHVDERVGEILTLSRQKNIPIEKLPSKKLRHLSKTSGHHQGVIAFAQMVEEPSLKKILAAVEAKRKVPFILIIPDVLYEHNFGAMLRTAEAVDVDAVLVSNRSLDITAVVARTAMGATEYVPVIHDNVFTAIKLLKKEGIRILGTKGGQNANVFTTDLTRGIAIVMGSEDSGISEPVEKLLDDYISIPMFGKIESLNMSVAAGIILYEVVRQRRMAKG